MNLFVVGAFAVVFTISILAISIAIGFVQSTGFKGYRRKR